MSANPHANGGLLRKPLVLPDFREYAVTVTSPATSEASRPRSWPSFSATRCEET